MCGPAGAQGTATWIWSPGDFEIWLSIRLQVQRVTSTACAGVEPDLGLAQRTLELNTREFFIDGVKRDHWVWSGDAVQTYLMNYYTFFDSDTVKRTTWALRGATGTACWKACRATGCSSTG